MTDIRGKYEELITKLKQEGTLENQWALGALQIDHKTFVEVLKKRLTPQPYVTPFVNVICDEELSQFFMNDLQFKTTTLKEKNINIEYWMLFVNGMRNYVRIGAFESQPSVSPPPSSDSVSLDPTRTQLPYGVPYGVQLHSGDKFSSSRSIGPSDNKFGGRKSRAKPRRKTNKNRTRRKSIKKLHRRK